MKLTVAWNVWSNYEDVLLGSEILRKENKEKKIFKQLNLISQGGYPTPPSDAETMYLDGFFNVDIDEAHPLIVKHVKFKGVFRVLNGLKNAYKYGLESKSDFVIVTNGDAWVLDIVKLKALLEGKDIQNTAISSRIGPCNGLYLNYGDFVPFFDDHFMIINVKKCKEHKVFEYDTPKAYNANFLDFGGIHYILIAMMDELVPDGLFNIYTMLESSINHYGEKSGFSLLPWQYDIDTSFLHANCMQEPYLHRLRAAQLEVLGFDKYPKIKAYCNQHNDRNNIIVNKEKKLVYFRKDIKQNIQYSIVTFTNKVKYLLLKNIIKKRELKYFSDKNRSFYYFKLYEDILPIGFVSRSLKNKQ